MLKIYLGFKMNLNQVELDVALSYPNKKVIKALISHGATFDRIDHVKGKSVDALVEKDMATAIEALVESLKKREGSLTVEWEVSGEDNGIYGSRNVLHTALRYRRNEIEKVFRDKLPLLLYFKLNTQTDMYGKTPWQVEQISKKNT